MDIEQGKEFEKNSTIKRKYTLIGMAVVLALLLSAVLWYVFGSSKTETGALKMTKESEKTNNNDKNSNVGTSSSTPTTPEVPFNPLYKEKMVYVTRTEDVKNIRKSHIYAIDLEEESDKQIIYPEDGSDPEAYRIMSLKRVSPDGEWILFVQPNGNISSMTYIMRKDGTDLRPLGEGEGLFFSPDGQSILLQKLNPSGETKAIQIVDLKGKVIHSWREDLKSSQFIKKFSSDGKTVIISSGWNDKVYSAKTETGELVQKDIFNSKGLVSPDLKKQIHFTYTGNIAISDLDGKNEHEIGEEDHEYSHSIWSQDGMRILTLTKKSDSTSSAGKTLQILELNPDRTAVVDTKDLLDGISIRDTFTW